MNYSSSGSSVHGFSRQEYWSGSPFPSPGDLPNPGIEPWSLALQANSLPSEPPGKPGFVKGEVKSIWRHSHPHLPQHTGDTPWLSHLLPARLLALANLWCQMLPSLLLHSSSYPLFLFSHRQPLKGAHRPVPSWQDAEQGLDQVAFPSCCLVAQTQR